jgi:hypothetical protein
MMYTDVKTYVILWYFDTLWILIISYNFFFNKKRIEISTKFYWFYVDKGKEKEEKTSDPIYHILVLSALEPAAVYR